MKEKSIEIPEELIQDITLKANITIHKKHPDMSVQSWQTRYILWAIEQFKQEAKKK